VEKNTLRLGLKYFISYKSTRTIRVSLPYAIRLKYSESFWLIGNWPRAFIGHGAAAQTRGHHWRPWGNRLTALIGVHGTTAFGNRLKDITNGATTTHGTKAFLLRNGIKTVLLGPGLSSKRETTLSTPEAPLRLPPSETGCGLGLGLGLVLFNPLGILRWYNTHLSGANYK
jgi:hypothetical protein